MAYIPMPLSIQRTRNEQVAVVVGISMPQAWPHASRLCCISSYSKRCQIFHPAIASMPTRQEICTRMTGARTRSSARATGICVLQPRLSPMGWVVEELSTTVPPFFCGAHSWKYRSSNGISGCKLRVSPMRKGGNYSG